MALITGQAERSLVSVIFQVTARTHSSHFFRGCLGVTVGTGRSGMLACQLETGGVMLKTGRLPGVHFMAFITHLAKLAVVHVIFSVTFTAGARSGLEIGQLPGF